MIWFVVLGVILVGVLILCLGKIQVGLTWSNLEGTLSFRYLFVRKQFPLRSKRGEKIESAEKKKDSEKKADQKKPGSPLRFLRAVPKFFPAVSRFIRLFFRYGKITQLNLEGEVGTGDPYYTGISYGLAQYFGHQIKNALPQMAIILTPNFEEEIYDLSASMRGEIRLFNLLVIIFVTVVYLPKREIWHLVRSGR